MATGTTAMEMAGMHRMATEVIVILAGSMIFSAALAWRLRLGLGGYGQNGYGRSNAGADDEESVYFRAALNYISSGHYKEALNVLNNIPQHSAQWYYYSSIANQGLGNNAAALEQAKKATEMEPQNAEYAGWRQRMESGGSWYTGRQTQYGGMPVSSGSGFCWKLCLANLICNLCCGGGGLCCGGMPAGYHL